MALKLEVENLDTVPEAQRVLYKEANGKFLLDAEGADEIAATQAKLSEFRNTNNAILKQLEEAKKAPKMTADEVAEIKRLKELEKDLKGKQTVTLAELEDRVNERTSKLREELTGKATEAEQLAKKYQTEYERERVGNVLRSEAAKAGILPEALDDVMYRGDRVFRLHEGEVRAFDGKGEMVYGRDGPLKVDEWFTGLSASAKHLFAPNAGSGAEGSRKSNGRVDFEKMTGTERIAYGLVEKGMPAKGGF